MTLVGMRDEWLGAEIKSSDSEGDAKVSPLNEYVGGGAASLLDMEEKTQGEVHRARRREKQ
jgi:hypothetical protein